MPDASRSPVSVHRIGETLPDLLHVVREVDAVELAEVQAEVSSRMAARLRAQPLADRMARREYARATATQVLRERGRIRLQAGMAPYTVEEERDLIRSVLDGLFGVGALQPYIDDDTVENIEVNGCDNVWISYADGRLERVPAIATSDEEVIELVQNLVARTGAGDRTFSTASPSVHIRLDDGSRLAAMAWVTPRPQIVIRRHRIIDATLADLVALGSMSRVVAEFLGAAIRAGRNVIVTGVQDTGKTTLLRALAAEFHPTERFGTIEQERELLLEEIPDRHPRIVAMEARVGSGELDASGRPVGEITLSRLVKDALRMTLRRIIVGEVRGPEIVPMLQAMSTGDGSMCTIHARAASEAMGRIVSLCLENGHGMTESYAYHAAAGGIDFVVHMEKVHPPGGRVSRYVAEILEVGGIGDSGRPVITQVFAPGSDGHATPAHNPTCLGDLIAVGFDPSLLDAGTRRQAFRGA